jgi:hypothetical protein
MRNDDGTRVAEPEEGDKKPAMLRIVAVIAVVVQAMVAVAGLVVAVIALREAIGHPTLEEANAHMSAAAAAEVHDIRRLIDDEAAAALDHNVEKAVGLYAPNAVVRDGLGEIGKALKVIPPDVETTWFGLEKIRERYTHLERFNELEHVNVTVTFEPGGQTARAVGSTSGEMVNPDGTVTPISSIDGEMWTFEKIDGAWKILSFTYNAR